MEKNITITKVYLLGLRLAYNKAVQDGVKQFTFDENEFVTNYAKYFLEFYEPQFGIKK